MREDLVTVRSDISMRKTIEREKKSQPDIQDEEMIDSDIVNDNNTSEDEVYFQDSFISKQMIGEWEDGSQLDPKTGQLSIENESQIDPETGHLTTTSFDSCISRQMIGECEDRSQLDPKTGHFSTVNSEGIINLENESKIDPETGHLMTTRFDAVNIVDNESQLDPETGFLSTDSKNEKQLDQETELICSTNFDNLSPLVDESQLDPETGFLSSAGSVITLENQSQLNQEIELFLALHFGSLFNPKIENHLSQETELSGLTNIQRLDAYENHLHQEKGILCDSNTTNKTVNEDEFQMELSPCKDSNPGIISPFLVSGSASNVEFFESNSRGSVIIGEAEAQLPNHQSPEESQEAEDDKGKEIAWQSISYH